MTTKLKTPEKGRACEEFNPQGQTRIESERSALEAFESLIDQLEQKARMGNLTLGENENWKLFQAASASGVSLRYVTNRLASVLGQLSQSQNARDKMVSLTNGGYH